MTVDPAGAEESEPYRGVHALVLGAAGFLGRWVARALTARGARSTLAVRDAGAAGEVFRRWSVAGDVLEWDLEAEGSARALVERVRPEITFNLAGYGVDRSEKDERKAWRINRDLVEELARSAGQGGGGWRGLHLVHVGSALEYGTISGDLAEESQPSPTTLYGRSKLAGTEAVRCAGRERGLPSVTARLFTVYGPGEHEGRLLPSLLEVARVRRPLPLTTGTQRRDFTYVADAAEGLLRLGIAPGEPGQVVNLGRGRLSSVRSFAETAARTLGFPAELLRFGQVPTRSEEMEHADVNVERLRRRTGWTPPTDVADGIRASHAFLSVGPPPESAP